MLGAAEPVSMEAGFSLGHLLRQPGSCRVIMGNESFALRGEEAPLPGLSPTGFTENKAGRHKDLYCRVSLPRKNRSDQVRQSVSSGVKFKGGTQ